MPAIRDSTVIRRSEYRMRFRMDMRRQSSTLRYMARCLRVVRLCVGRHRECWRESVVLRAGYGTVKYAGLGHY